MIGPGLVSILVNPFNERTRESLGLYDRLLKTTIISELDKKRRRVAAWSSVGNSRSPYGGSVGMEKGNVG